MPVALIHVKFAENAVVAFDRPLPKTCLVRKPAYKNALTTRLAMQTIELARRDNWEAGRHVTEQMIGEQFGVSRTPVRKALNFLEEMGVLRGERNRGYFLEKSGKALQRIAPASAPDSEEEIYLRIGNDRLRGKLPAELGEAEVMRRYDISRTQAQRLLHRMFGEGLISPKQGRGWAFEPVLDSLEAHNESYRFRITIEAGALLEPTFRINEAEFEALRREQQAMLDGNILKLSRVQLFEIGSRFHETVVAWSRNRFFLDAIRRQNQLRRLIEYRAHLDRSRLTRQCQEHLKLLDLIRSGDKEAAAAFIKRHLDVVRSIKTGGAPEPINSSAVHAQL